MLIKLEKFYNKNYKILTFIPVIVFVIALGLIINQYVQTGDFVNKDVSLRGGISSSVYTDKYVELGEIQKGLGVDSNTRRLTDFSTGKSIGYVIEVSDLKEEQLRERLIKVLGVELNNDNFSIEETGAVLGQSFYKELLIALGFAFIFMAIVVFITFKNFIPSIAVIQAALSDIVITLAIINLIGMKISTAGIVAFLMITGYSIDTDILQTTRALKRTGGRLFERIYSAMKTGLTMTFTTIAALTAAYFLTQSYVLKDMFLILIIALFVDIFNTYLTNTGIIMWYYKKKFGENEQG